MVPSSFRVPVPSSYALPYGALALAVDPVTDFDRRDDADNQARDKDTGLPLWVISVIDLDPQAAKFGRDRIKVKVAALDRPTLPESAVPGYPPAVEFTDLVLVPWVDNGRCRGSGECRARMAFSMRASGVIASTIQVGRYAEGVA